MPQRKIVLSILSLFLVLVFTEMDSRSQSIGKKASDFNQLKNQKPVRERVALCFQSLKNETDSEILMECLKDISKFSRFKNNDSEVIADLNQFIERTDVDNSIIRRAKLAKARIYRRLLDPEGDRIFEQAVLERWDGTGDAYCGSLEETGDYERRAKFVLQQWYASEKDEDMFYIGSVFRQWKRFQYDKNFSETVYPQLLLSEKHPQSAVLLKGWCFIFDERYPEAIQEFLKAKKELEKNPALAKESSNPLYREAENVLLYLALAQFLEGRDIQAAKNNTQQYLKTSTSNPKLRLQRVLSITWYLNGQSNLSPEKFMPMLLDLVQLVRESDLFKNPEVAAKADPEWIARIYDTQQMALAWTGHRDESEALCLSGMQLFYPGTFPGTNMAHFYAAAMLEKNQYKEAENLFRDILKNTNWDELIPVVKFSLAKALLAQGKVNETYPLLEDILEWGKISSARLDQSVCSKANALYQHLKECEAEGRDYRLYKAR